MARIELDPPVVRLVRALNEVPGIRTKWSCGGHERPVSPDSAPAGEWWVSVELDERDGGSPTARAWYSLEFLAWFAAVRGCTLRAESPPPWRHLAFRLAGSCNADELAARLMEDAAPRTESDRLYWRSR